MQQLSDDLPSRDTRQSMHAKIIITRIGLNPPSDDAAPQGQTFFSQLANPGRNALFFLPATKPSGPRAVRVVVLVEVVVVVGGEQFV